MGKELAAFFAPHLDLKSVLGDAKYVLEINKMEELKKKSLEYQKKCKVYEYKYKENQAANNHLINGLINSVKISKDKH